MANLSRKFAIPASEPRALQRTRLIERLQTGLLTGRRLSLLAAPAGTGKSALVAAWAAEADRPFAWLTLEAGDDTVARFLAVVGAALRHAVPQAPRPAPTTALGTSLGALVDDLAAAAPLVVVLDDLHLIAAPAIYALIEQLLDATPSSVHIVLITRVEPPLPLARMRASGLLTELRANDLRFTTAEIADWYAWAYGVALTPPLIAALEQRTEGWAAGLQLAGYALQDCPDLAEGIRRFDGSHYVVIEYLTSQVFQSLPGELRTFLGETAALARLCAPLCEAVTENPRSAELLARAVQANLFLSPLDDQHTWFRYHPLFAAAVCASLQPPGQPVRHRHAAEWFASHSQLNEAIRHALASGDHVFAAGMIGAMTGQVLDRKRLAELLGELNAAPALLSGDNREPRTGWPAEGPHDDAAWPSAAARIAPSPETIPGSRDALVLIEPISLREVDVLELLAAGLTYAEIADRLVVSVNTVRSHVKHLYSKLGVHMRTQALNRARELQLL